MFGGCKNKFTLKTLKNIKNYTELGVGLFLVYSEWGIFLPPLGGVCTNITVWAAETKLNEGMKKGLAAEEQMNEELNT